MATITVTRVRVFAYVILFGASGVAMGYGILNGNQGNAALVAQIAGSFFGVTVGLLLNTLIGDDLTDALKRLLTKPRFTSPRSGLHQYARAWHVYYKTVQGGQEFWVHSTANFSITSDETGLVGVSVASTKGSPETTYRLEAAFRGRSLVVFGASSDPDEEPSIEVLPRFQLAHRKVRCGVIVHEPYDSEQPMRLSPIIYCQDALAGVSKVGELGTEDAGKLLGFWNDNMKKQFTVDAIFKQ